MAKTLGLGALGAVALVVLVLGPLFATGQLDLSETLTGIAGFTWGQRAQILLIGLFAAILEETVFRGYLQPGLVARLGFPAGLVLGAVVFALYHLPMGLDLGQLAAKAVLGASARLAARA